MIWGFGEALAELTFDGYANNIFLQCELLFSLIISCKFIDGCFINRLAEPKNAHYFNFMHADLPDIEDQLLKLILVHLCMEGDVFDFYIVY